MPLDLFWIDPSLNVSNPSASFEAGVVASLNACTALTAIVGQNIDPLVVPQKAVLPALTYQVVSGNTGHVLKGSNATKVYRVQFSAVSQNRSVAESIHKTLFDLFDGLYNTTLSNGVVVLSALQTSPPLEIAEYIDNGTDDRTFRLLSDYLFKVRNLAPQR